MMNSIHAGIGAAIRKIPDPLLTNRRIVFVESILILLAVWQLVYAVSPTFANAFTSPVRVAEATYALLVSMVWVDHVLATIRHVLYGFCAAVVIGTGLGIVFGWSDYFHSAFKDYLTIGLAFPSVFAVIFGAMWFGIGSTTPIVAAALIALPFQTVNVYEGVKSIDNDVLLMSRSFDVSRKRTIRHVIIPAILPAWFSAIRYTLALSWQVSNLAEFIAAEEGVGYMIHFEMRVLDLAGVLSWVVLVIGFLLFMEYVVFASLERRLFAWREEVSVGWT